MLIISKKVSLGTPAIADVTDVANCVIACDWKSGRETNGPMVIPLTSADENGFLCGKWSDRSGATNHLLQGTDANAPAYLNAWDGGANKMAMDFDGEDNFMATAGNVSVMTTIAVYNWEGAAAFPASVGLATNNVANCLQGRNGSTVAAFDNATPILDTDLGRTIAMLPASTARIALAVDLSHTAAPMVVGRRVTAGYWNGKIAAVYAWSRALRYSEIKQVHDLIAGWYGVTLGAW